MKTGILIILSIAVLGFAYWTISPFFITEVVMDEMPMDASVSAAVEVVDTPAHPATGTVRILTSADGSHAIRYEDYETLNGPDLYVYLAKDLDAKEFVSLGAIRGTKGDITYPIPDDIKLSDYPYVLTWCRAFSTLFNSADISTLVSATTPTEEMFCAQVITPARNPDTGAIVEFPTPCDVPSGWEVVENEVPTLDLDIQ